jgi:carboxyl-terminal processing protease
VGFFIILEGNTPYLMRIVLTLLLLCHFSFSLSAQSSDSKAMDAFLITRMVDKFHVQPRPLDKAMSVAIYNRMLQSLDGERIFFTQADIAALTPYRTILDEEIRNRRTGFLQLLTGLYQQRLMQVDTMIDHIAARPFTFPTIESISIAEDSSYPADMQALHTKLYKLMKLSVATRLANAILARDTSSTRRGDDRQGIAGSGDPKSNRQLIDSLEPKLRKKAVVSTKRFIKRLLQSPTGIGNMIGIIYCQALAECYDPHTTYFSPDEKASFETELGNKPLSYGLTLGEDEDGHAIIDHLLPGGPAFQSGGLSEGDKPVAIRWDGKEPIDVADAGAAELYRILSADGGNKLVLDVKKADGTIKQVSLTKQKVSVEADDEEEDKVTGFLLKGQKTVGYISLPAFYEDWEDSKGVNGCANDVAKEIIKLKKEGIGGLILDLRYNGGGSVQEAVALAGLFIDAGPVGQVKAKDERVYTLKDVVRGTVWDGPLLVLVNGNSASASEVVAGTLQDYNRALIVGSPTYGKATAQIVLPMDTTIELATLNPKAEAASYIKVTISKLYRINGATAQFSGVIPDVALPDPPDANAHRESDEAFALPPTPIEPNKYYRALPPLPVAAEKTIATTSMSTNEYFRQAAGFKKADNPAWRRYSLNVNDIIAEKKAAELPVGSADTTAEKNTIYTVASPAYENQRLQADKELADMNEARKKDVLYDPYLMVAYQLAVGMIKP